MTSGLETEWACSQRKR